MIINEKLSVMSKIKKGNAMKELAREPPK